MLRQSPRGMPSSPKMARAPVVGLFTKAFGDPVVSVYEGTIKVGEMTEESALKAGIPRCGA